MYVCIYGMCVKIDFIEFHSLRLNYLRAFLQINRYSISIILVYMCVRESVCVFGPTDLLNCCASSHTD